MGYGGNKAWGEFIPSGGINDVIAAWQNKQPEREQSYASPSSLYDCPRVIWLRRHKVEPTNQLGWGKKQRFMLGRITENTIASQLRDEGMLLYHWKDDYAGESIKFWHGEGLDRIEGTPDLLLKLDGKVLISDSKTSRSDSFRYVPINPLEIWADPFWKKYKRQLEAYFMLCHWNKGWFESMRLPLPEACHLFSYALDNGIVHRELTWVPNKDDAAEVLRLIKRWNSAYNAATMPDCTCQADGTVKFCPYGIMEAGKKVCDSCCASDLYLKEVEVETAV